MKHLNAILVGALTFYSVSWDCLAAEPSNDVRTEVVRFADLDLTRPAGAQELYRRIAHAAGDVCESLGADPYAVNAYMTCRKGAIARAIRDVGTPLVMEQHRALMD